MIVVLSGGSAERLEKGIELLQQGYAPCLLLLLPDRVEPSILNHDGIVQKKRINLGLLNIIRFRWKRYCGAMCRFTAPMVRWSG